MTLPHLGLVCITRADTVRYRTVTRTHLGKFSAAERQRMLAHLYRDNVERLDRAVRFCQEATLRLYRITSNLLPFADTPEGAPILAEIAPDLARIGQRAHEAGIRLVLHPEQFVVLNSESPAVVTNAIAVLAHHARVLDLLNQPRSPWAAIQIHGGKGGRAEALVAAVADLPEEIRCRLAFENDEYAFGAEQILQVCRQAGVPMVFDAHHHLCHARLTSYEDPSIAHYLAAAATTWPDPGWQLTHISNGLEGIRDRRHSDFIAEMPSSFCQAPWIEVEAKAKEEAIARLRTEWLVPVCSARPGFGRAGDGG